MDKLFLIQESVPPSPLLTDIKAYWKFDDDLIDATGNGNDGTGINNPTFVAGKIDDAVHFVATQGVLVPASTDVSPGTNVSFTYALWVNLASKASNMEMFSKWDDPDYNAGFDLRYHSGLDQFLFNCTNGSVAAETFGSPSTDTWYLLFAGYDADVDKYFIGANDTFDYDDVEAGGNPDAVSSLHFGVESNGITRPLNGNLDECGIWHRVLTSEERTTLYNSGAGITYPFEA